MGLGGDRVQTTTAFSIAMGNRSLFAGIWDRPRNARWAWLAAGLVAMLAGPAMSQNAPQSLAPPAPQFQGPATSVPPPAPEAQPPAAVPAAPANPLGMFEALGRWLDDGAASVRDNLRGAKSRMDELDSKAAADRKEFEEKAEAARKNATEATKNAVDAVARIPVSRVMSGRERCTEAPNGAPDCIAAAHALCRKHGYSAGNSLDFTSAEECPPRWVSGRPAAGECITVTFISRAMCQ
jgi:hypothetical protein